MYVFIATIFIAEMIIAGFIIYWLCRFNKIVNSTISQAKTAGEMTISSLKQARKILNSAQKLCSNYINFFIDKKKIIRNKIINLVLINIILVLFKTRFKKAATILQYVLLLKDFWNSIPA